MEEAGRPSNYKTVMCKSWQIKRECALGNRCNFAHGAEELRPHGAAPALAKGEKKKTAADVDRMDEKGLIDAETAGLMKSSIKRREAPAPAKTAADDDRMVEKGLIDAETAGLMKSSIKRREAPAPAKTAADVDRMVDRKSVV